MSLFNLEMIFSFSHFGVNVLEWLDSEESGKEKVGVVPTDKI